MSVDGILVINKPADRTSRWATTQVSRLLRQKKAGHLGTLDPLATGVLPIALGQATRLIRFLESEDKVYEAVIRLGAATDSQDRTGAVIFQGEYASLDPGRIAAALSAFQGEVLQVPPMHSARKQGGVPLYRLARKGISVPREPKRVLIHSLELLSIALPDLAVRARCSPGTYMRTLAHDLGEKLGCGAHLQALVRLSSGPFSIKQAVELPGLTLEAAAERLIPLADCLPHFPALELSAASAFAVQAGKAPAFPEPSPLEPRPGQRFRLIHQGRLLAVAESREQEGRVILQPVRVMSQP